MLDSIDVKNFYSDKDPTRFEYLKRSILIVGLIAVAHVIYSLKFSHRNTSTGLQWTFDIIVGSILLVWTLSSEFVTLIRLDFKSRKFVAHYITLFKDDKRLEIPFELLTFEFKKTPTRHQAKKWTLKVLDRKRKVFSIDTDQDGFSQETLNSLAEELKKIHLLV